MARSESLADQRRPADVEDRKRAADEKTAVIERQIKALDEMLTSALQRPPLTFESLLATPAAPEFDPGSMGPAPSAPDWDEFAPAQPHGLSRFLRAASYSRQLAAARGRFETAQADYRHDLSRQQRAVAVAKAQHDREITEERAKAAKHNADIVGQRAAFAAGDAGSVEWFTGRVLEASPYPDVFPRKHKVAYRPEDRDVLVEFELPPSRIVPAVRAFRYVTTQDTIEPLPRPDAEIKQRYGVLIAAIALRTLHEIFGSTPADVVAAVTFNGRVSSIDRATGKPIRPHLLSVCADRASFKDLVLAAVDPVACLAHLNAIVSPDPAGLVPVRPFLAFEGGRFHATKEVEDLLGLSPSEFEHLIRRLLEAMGANGWTPVPTRDGTVSAVVTSKNVLFGGVCLVHAIRRDGLVGLDAVQSLSNAMADHDATVGVLVTTSWFGRATEEFARRNHITLINGAELGQAIKEHLGIDVPSSQA